MVPVKRQHQIVIQHSVTFLYRGYDSSLSWVVCDVPICHVHVLQEKSVGSRFPIRKLQRKTGEFLKFLLHISTFSDAPEKQGRLVTFAEKM